MNETTAAATLLAARTAVVEGWRALTARGRGFVSAGLSALGAALVVAASVVLALAFAAAANVTG